MPRLMRRLLVTVPLIALLLGSSISAQNPHLRDPTPAERAVLNHYRDVIHSVLDKFQSDDWDENVDYDVADDVLVSDSRDRPLDVNEMMQRTYTIRNGSALFQKEIAPFVEKFQTMHDPAQMAALAKQMIMNRYSVEVHFNQIAVTVDPANPDLHLTGAAFSYRIKNFKYDKGTSVVLLFGDWKDSWKGGDDGYRYKFKHATHQPVIENVVIQFDGSPERINELLRTVDWRPVNDALTH